MWCYVPIRLKHLLISLFICFMVSKAEPTSCDDSYWIPKAYLGKFFYWSDGAPLTKALAKLQPVREAVELVLTHFANVEDALLQAVSESKKYSRQDTVNPCNIPDRSFAGAVEYQMWSRSWLPNSHSCTSDIFGTLLRPGKTLPYTDDHLFEVLQRRGEAIESNIKSITEAVISNFTDPDFQWNYRFETGSQKCVLHTAVGYRVGMHWYMQHAITEPNRHVFTNFRQRVEEYARVVDGKLVENVQMCLPQRPKEGIKHVLKNGTSVIITSLGNDNLVSFSEDASTDTNEALSPSFDKADPYVQEAEAVLTPSNIAILLLPMVLNLIPISLFAEVSTFQMFLYTVMSDVLTVLPFGIKGVELIKIGSQAHRTVKVRITTPYWTGVPQRNLTVNAAGAQIYAAECRAHDNIRPAGLAFLVTAIVFLIGGVAAEIVARYWRKKIEENRRLKKFQGAGRAACGNGGSKSKYDYESDLTEELENFKHKA